MPGPSPPRSTGLAPARTGSGTCRLPRPGCRRAGHGRGPWRRRRTAERGGPRSRPAPTCSEVEPYSSVSFGLLNHLANAPLPSRSAGRWLTWAAGAAVWNSGWPGRKLPAGHPQPAGVTSTATRPRVRSRMAEHRRAVTAGWRGPFLRGWCNRAAALTSCCPSPPWPSTRAGVASALAQAMGMVGQPRGAPLQRVRRQAIPATVPESPSPVGGRPPPGGRAGDRPRPARHQMRRLKQERSSCSIGYGGASTTGSREQIAATHRAGAAHRIASTLCAP